MLLVEVHVEQDDVWLLYERLARGCHRMRLVDNGAVEREQLRQGFTEIVVVLDDEDASRFDVGLPQQEC